jgi:hypothetical protein
LVLFSSEPALREERDIADAGTLYPLRRCTALHPEMKEAEASNLADFSKSLKRFR